MLLPTALAGVGGASPAFPDRPIEIIAPARAGGGWDTLYHRVLHRHPAGIFFTRSLTAVLIVLSVVSLFAPALLGLLRGAGLTRRGLPLRRRLQAR